MIIITGIAASSFDRMSYMLPRDGELESGEVNPDASFQFQVRCVHLLHPQIYLLGRSQKLKRIQL